MQKGDIKLQLTNLLSFINYPFIFFYACISLYVCCLIYFNLYFESYVHTPFWQNKANVLFDLVSYLADHVGSVVDDVWRLVSLQYKAS